MQLRLTGKKELVERCAALLKRAGFPVNPVPVSSSDASAMDIELDDKAMAVLLDNAELGRFPGTNPQQV